MKVCLLLVLFVYVLSQSAPLICSTDSDCNNYNTFNTLYCINPGNVTTASCPTKTLVQFNNTISSSSQMCTNSLLLQNSIICGQYATAGCLVDNVFTRCVNSNYNFTTGRCDPINMALYTYSNVGERCGTIVNGNLTVCKTNLMCVQSVCRPTLNPFDNCYSVGQPNPIGCGLGFTCDYDICIPALSRVAQDPCKTNGACTEQDCYQGRCTEKRSIPCLTNTDCPSGSTCYNNVCTRGTYLAQKYLIQCLSSQCSAPMGNIDFINCAATNCENQIVENVCQNQCQNRPDQRFLPDGYTYDCKAKTRTLIQPNTCSVTQFVANCDLPISGAFLNGLSFTILLIVSFIFA